MTEKKLNQYLTDFPESQLNYYGLVIGNTYADELSSDEELETVGKDLSCVFKEITLRRFDLDEPWKLVSHIEEKSLTNAFEAFELLREYFSNDVVEEDEDCDCCEPDCPICQAKKEQMDQDYEEMMDLQRAQ